MIEGNQTFLHTCASYPLVMGDVYPDIHEKIKGKYIYFHIME